MFHIRPSREQRFLAIREDNTSENQDLIIQDSTTSNWEQTQNENKNKKTKKKSPPKPASTTEPGKRKSKPVPSADSRTQHRSIATTELGLLNGDHSHVDISFRDDQEDFIYDTIQSVLKGDKHYKNSDNRNMIEMIKKEGNKKKRRLSSLDKNTTMRR